MASTPRFLSASHASQPSVFYNPTIPALTGHINILAGVGYLPGYGPPGIPVPFCGAVHSESSFTAAWTPTTPGTAAYFTVQWRPVGDIPFTTINLVSGTSTVISGLDPDTAYEFMVDAVNADGESGYSDLFTCSTNPLPGVLRVLLPPAMLQFCDADGHPYAGGTLEMLVRGTDTPKDTWTTPEGGDENLNTNPIELDSAGRALIYGDGGYRTILRDADGNLVWDQPSFTYVSSAMAPVVGAATIADAVVLLGIQDLIDIEAAARAAADSAEQSARIAADAAETAARIAADATEAAARAAADAVLQAAIDGLVTGGALEGDGAAWCWTDAASGFMLQGGEGLTSATVTFFKPFPVGILGWPMCTLRDFSVSATSCVNGYGLSSFICSAFGSSHSDLRGGEHFSYIAAGY